MKSELPSDVNELEILLRNSDGAWVRVRSDTPPQSAQALRKYLEEKGFKVDSRSIRPIPFEVDPENDVTLFVQEEKLDDKILLKVGGYLDAAREYLAKTGKSQVFVSTPETDTRLLKFAPNTLSRSHPFNSK